MNYTIFPSVNRTHDQATPHGLILSAKVRLHSQAGPRHVLGTATGPVLRTPEERSH